MTETTSKVLIVRSEVGDLYVLTEESLAPARATKEQRAAIEAVLEDVQGFFTPVPIPLAQPISFEGGSLGSVTQLPALRLVLPRDTLAARPAIGPRPGV